MHLLRLRVFGLAPFKQLTLPFADDDGRPRMVSVVHGGGGVGKTTILHAIASTRPGHTVVLNPAGGASSKPPYVAADWAVGDDDPERPHALTVATPNARLTDDDDLETFRRREQTLFDKIARERGGFVFIALSSTRWFARQPLALSAPARTIARYDVRMHQPLDDAARAELSRDTKQALAYAEIGAQLARSDRTRGSKLEILGTAMRSAVNALVTLAGYTYEGLDPSSFEPVFLNPTGQRVTFDLLPTHARHLVAFSALPTRVLWAAYPGHDPRCSEAVVGIDDVDLHLDPTVQRKLVPALRAALPEVQWILTTAGPEIPGACDSRDVLALRRDDDAQDVILYTGHEARVH